MPLNADGIGDSAGRRPSSARIGGFIESDLFDL
jgi:hypothetical protein